ncbi:hypothetical protein B2J90_28995 (plasmid) [Bacillus tropicus]|uniref:hypothetical protein n=1 Tax=Bacillus tropicus TaxID=2026188 RepID=UPI000A20209C|nr:hypothetical protein B2J90_28995 [Bacillus cereus]
MKKLIATVLTVGLAATILTGCNNDPYMQKQDDQVISIDYKMLIKDKLYYIPHENGKADLPPRYEKLLTDNPSLEVISVSVNTNENTNNSINGYYIFTKKKEDQ